MLILNVANVYRSVTIRTQAEMPINT